MISTKQRYVTTAASLAVGLASAGTAEAAPVLTSKAGANFTPVTFTGTNTDLTGKALGSFDTSGASLNPISVTSNPFGTTPKLTFSSNGQIATDSQGIFAPVLVAAYQSAPSTLSNFSPSANLDKGATSNFSSTPMFGFTTYAANGGTAVGYFQGSFASNTTSATFTLLDYGTATGVNVSAVPEPGTWAMLATGFAGIGFALRRRRKSGVAMSAAAA